jgi:hypothetical protein
VNAVECCNQRHTSATRGSIYAVERSTFLKRFVRGSAHNWLAAREASPRVLGPSHEGAKTAARETSGLRHAAPPRARSTVDNARFVVTARIFPLI